MLDEEWLMKLWQKRERDEKYQWRVNGQGEKKKREKGVRGKAANETTVAKECTEIKREVIKRK